MLSIQCRGTMPGLRQVQYRSSGSQNGHICAHPDKWTALTLDCGRDARRAGGLTFTSLCVLCVLCVRATSTCRSYVACDLGSMCEEAGLTPDTKYLCSATKTLSFRKAVPGEAPATAPAADN